MTGNGEIRDLYDRIGKEWKDLLQTVHCIKLWLQLNIPRIEDGNNFGVAVQEEILQCLKRSEEVAYAFVSAPSKYYTERGKLASKVLKYPLSKDYKSAILERDELEMISVKTQFLDILDSYALIEDLLSKNWEKVTKPRGSNAGRSMVF
eukprot:Selendium_serpulae@DN2581_c0_g1_i3.p1